MFDKGHNSSKAGRLFRAALPPFPPPPPTFPVLKNAGGPL